MPDETVICRYRHLLEKDKVGESMPDTVNCHLGERAIKIATGTIADATILHAPSSTKDKAGERNP